MLAGLLPGLLAHAQCHPCSRGPAHGLEAGVQPIVVLKHAHEEQLEVPAIVTAVAAIAARVTGLDVGRPGRQGAHACRVHVGDVAGHGPAGQEEVEARLVEGHELAAVGDLEPGLENRVDALTESGEAPVDVTVEDANGHAGALAVTEEGGVEHGVDGQVARLGQRVGDGRVLAVDELDSLPCRDRRPYPGHRPTPLRGVAGDLHDSVAEVCEGPSHRQGTQHGGGHPIRLKRKRSVEDHEPVCAHDVTSVLCMGPGGPQWVGLPTHGMLSDHLTPHKNR